jgi:hypothetical protein
MRFQQVLDSLPMLVVFGAFALGALLVSEGGFRVGRWWQTRTPEEKEGPTAMMARRGLVLAEANALGTTYLRAGYLPEPASSQIRGLLREYVPLRVVSTDLAGVQARIARSARW